MPRRGNESQVVVANTAKNYKKTPLYKNLNSKISKLKENEELHYRDYYNAGQAIPVAGMYISLTDLISENDTVNGRTGKEIIATSVQMKGELTTTAIANVQHNTIRIIVASGKKGRNNLTDLQDSTSPNTIPILDDSVAQYVIHSPYYYDETRNWKIYLDETIVLRADGGGPAIGTTYDVIKFFEYNIPLHRLDIIFKSSATAAATQNDIGVWLVAEVNNITLLRRNFRIFFHP